MVFRYANAHNFLLMLQFMHSQQL